MMRADYEMASRSPELEYGGVVAWNGYKAARSTSDELDRKEQYIQGYAVRWRSLIEQNGKYFYFMPGSIKMPMLGEPKKLLFDHDDSQIIATTRDGLLLHVDDYGLALRLHVPNTYLGRNALDSVRNHERTALSVGVTMHGNEYKDVDDVRVRIVTEASLHEISMVPSGACRPAFCMLVDAETCGTLEHDSKSMRLLADGAWSKLTKALRNLASEFGR